MWPSHYHLLLSYVSYVHAVLGTYIDIMVHFGESMESGSQSIDLESIVSIATRLGASYADARLQELYYELVVVDNGIVREYSITRSLGVGIRVLVNGYQGFASTNDLSRESIMETIRRALNSARAMSIGGKRIELASKPTCRAKERSAFKINPLDISGEDKVRVVLEANNASRRFDEVKSAVTRLGIQIDRRVYASSEGDYVEVEVVATGLAHVSVARVGDVMERVGDQKSYVAGYEFIQGNNWCEFSVELSKLAIKAAQAKTPPPGSYTVVLDNDIVGLLLHEAFGHASEGDSIEAGTSVLASKLGKKVASELITVVDEGVVEGGYFVPYDDEGVPKRRTVIVENGILKQYLHSRYTAKRLGQDVTGNARAQSYSHLPLVRQTNYYIEPRDYKVEELFEDIEFGIYVRGLGAFGGEVNTSIGTFTFSVGPSYMIRNGEIQELVRGVTLSGSILETLKEVDAVARDLKITTSVFGGCGKMGQTVRVGHGGPHIRVRRMVIGGR